MSDERRQKLQDRIAWLEASKSGLDRNFKRSPRFVVPMLLAAPAWYFGGGSRRSTSPSWRGLHRGVGYVAWSHLHENEIELKSVRAELRRLDAAAAKEALNRSDG